MIKHKSERDTDLEKLCYPITIERGRKFWKNRKKNRTRNSLTAWSNRYGNDALLGDALLLALYLVAPQSTQAISKISPFYKQIEAPLVLILVASSEAAIKIVIQTKVVVAAVAEATIILKRGRTRLLLV